MAEDTRTKQSIEELKTAAARAQSAYLWEEALSLYTQALGATGGETPPLPSQTAYELLDGRAEGYRHLGDLAAEEADLAAMAALASEIDDPARQVRVMHRQVRYQIQRGRLAEARQTAEAALALAREHADLPEGQGHRLEAGSLAALADACGHSGDLALSQAYAEEARGLFRELGDLAGQAQSQRLLAFLAQRRGETAQDRAFSLAALALYRQVGDQEGEGNALNGLGVSSSDHASQRARYEQALARFEAIGHIERQSVIYNNLGLVYHKLGLYGRAHGYGQRAVELGRKMGAQLSLAYFLDGPGRASLSLGELDRAEGFFEEGRTIAQAVGDRFAEMSFWLGLGEVALAHGRAGEARDLFQVAAEMAADVAAAADRATCLAWLGAAHLGLGDRQAARECTTQAVALLQTAGDAVGEYPAQEVWWWCYQALSEPSAVSVPQSDDAAWYALDRAREAMLASVATLSDDGLRRNYFNKVAINRQVVEAWLAGAAERGLPLAPMTDGLTGPVDPQAQLARMIEIGVRLNARREAGDLPGFILDEVVELTGAERAALFLLDDEGQRWVAAESAEQTLGVAGKPQGSWLDEIAPFLDEVAQKRVPILRHVPGRPITGPSKLRAGLPGGEGAELGQRSVLCAPLVAGGKLLGLVYTDLSGIYGRFTERDRDLLTVLANLAAVAVENAQWTETLEKRVVERTAELQAANERLAQRNAELSVINSIQQGLGQQLDFQAIIDLVGDKIGEIFAADSTNISLYDGDTKLVDFVYSVERGHRFYDEATTARPGHYLKGHREPPAHRLWHAGGCPRVWCHLLAASRPS